MKDKKFWAKVKKSRFKADCWEWQGAEDKYGYGRVVRLQYGKKPLKAHRYAFYLHFGRWPEGVCTHSCGNKACVKYQHLYDDVWLAAKKKPVVDGYLEDCAKQIQARYVKGSRMNSVAALANDYGLPINTVRQMVDGRFDKYVREFAAGKIITADYGKLVKEAKKLIKHYKKAT